MLMLLLMLMLFMLILMMLLMLLLMLMFLMLLLRVVMLMLMSFFADDHYVCSLSSKLRRHGSSVAGLLCSRPMAHGDTNELKAPAAL